MIRFCTDKYNEIRDDSREFHCWLPKWSLMSNQMKKRTYMWQASLYFTTTTQSICGKILINKQFKVPSGG